MSNSTAFLLGAFVAFLFVATIIVVKGAYTHKEIISHHCAQYNATTGDFEWLDTITKPQEPTR